MLIMIFFDYEMEMVWYIVCDRGYDAISGLTRKCGTCVRVGEAWRGVAYGVARRRMPWQRGVRPIPELAPIEEQT